MLVYLSVITLITFGGYLCTPVMSPAAHQLQAAGAATLPPPAPPIAADPSPLQVQRLQQEKSRGYRGVSGRGWQGGLIG